MRPSRCHLLMQRGLCPHTPGIFRFSPKSTYQVKKGRPTTRARRPHDDFGPGRRSSCIPAEPYPPAGRLQFISFDAHRRALVWMRQIPIIPAGSVITLSESVFAPINGVHLTNLQFFGATSTFPYYEKTAFTLQSCECSLITLPNNPTTPQLLSP